MTIPVHGKWTRIDGDPASGYVIISASNRIIATGTSVIVMQDAITETLSDTGEINIDLIATDDPDYYGSPFYYHIIVALDGTEPYHFDVLIPINTPGVFELATATPIGPQPELPPGQYVISVDGRSGVVTLTDLYASVGSVTALDVRVTALENAPPVTGIASLDDIGDVNVTGVVTGEVLTYDAGTWVASVPASGVSQAYVDAADATLQTNIDNEATTRASADTTLTNTKVNRSGDTIAGPLIIDTSAGIALPLRINANNTEAMVQFFDGNNVLVAQIDQDGDFIAPNITQIDTDLSTAEGNITTLQTGLSTEVTNRTNADTNLQNQINALPTDTDVSNAVAAEATLRTNADNALQVDIDDRIRYVEEFQDAPTTEITWDIDRVVVPADVDFFQVSYLGVPVFWLNEFGAPRIRVPAEFPNDNPLKLFPRVGSALQVIDVNGNILGGFAADGSLLASAWIPLVIDSPTATGRYTANPDGSGGFNSPQVRIIDGGKRAELRGRVNMASNGADNDIIATTVPTSISLGGKLISSVPTRNRFFPIPCTASSGRMRINSTGTVQLVGTMSGTFFSLDGIIYSLEL